MSLTKTVKCKILKEDFKKGVNYQDHKNCPITKALQRAGINGLHGGMTSIINNMTDLIEIGKIPFHVNWDVLYMCYAANGRHDLTRIEPADIEFEATLIF